MIWFDGEMELTNDELKNHIIEDGIRCCKKDEYLESYEAEGIVEGFNICRDLNAPEDFINMIQSRHEKEIGMIQNSGHTVKENDEYWKYFYATLQAYKQGDGYVCNVITKDDPLKMIW